MKIKKVEGIIWSGGVIDSYALLHDGLLQNDSIVVAPTLYLLDLAKRGKSENTIIASAKDLKIYFESLVRAGISWTNITDNQMSEYVKKVLHGELKLQENSIKRNISTLRGFYKTSNDTGRLSQPTLYTFTYSSPGQRKHQGHGKGKINYKLYEKYICPSIFDQILASVHSRSHFIQDRDEMVMLLGYHCGLRTSEVTEPINLQTKDLKDRLKPTKNGGTLSITIPILGKGNKIRHVVAPPRICVKLDNFLTGSRSLYPDGPLICSHKGTALSESHATRVFKKSIKTCLPKIKKVISLAEVNPSFEYVISLESAKELSFHSLRHTYATNLVTWCYEHGIDPWQYVPEQMGHEDEETTKAYVLFEANVYGRDAIRRDLSESVES